MYYRNINIYYIKLRIYIFSSNNLEQFFAANSLCQSLLIDCSLGWDEYFIILNIDQLEIHCFAGCDKTVPSKGILWLIKGRVVGIMLRSLIPRHRVLGCMLLWLVQLMYIHQYLTLIHLTWHKLEKRPATMGHFGLWITSVSFVLCDKSTCGILKVT